jgi:hypothetical protein
MSEGLLVLFRDWLNSNSVHIAVEAALLAAVVALLLQRSFKPQKKPLTERVRRLAVASTG